MQDRYVIMNTGFKNIVKNEQIVGFQINIRIPYYRGTFLSSVQELSLHYDGIEVPRTNLRIATAGKEMSIFEAEEADDVRWVFGEPATLLAMVDGGLDPGLHVIEVGIGIRKSYTPPEDPERLFPPLWRDGKYTPFSEPPTVVKKKMTLVQ